MIKLDEHLWMEIQPDRNGINIYQAPDHVIHLTPEGLIKLVEEIEKMIDSRKKEQA